MKMEADINVLKKTSKEIFSDIFKKDFVRLCYYANNFISDIDVCKDIVQDVFIKLWEFGIDDKSEDELYRILYRSVKNKSFDYLKNLKVRHNYRVDILKRFVECQDYSFSDYEIRELSVRIEKELNKLPEQTHNIFELSRTAGKSYSDIAELLDISVKSVEFHISKALRALRIGLKDYLPLLSAGLINLLRLF